MNKYFNDKELHTLKHLLKNYIINNHDRLNVQHEEARKAEGKRGNLKRVYERISYQESKIQALYILDDKLNALIN